MNRVFVLSPANCNGLRAQWVLKKNSRSDLAIRLRGDGVPLGEVFTYLSALYFRGKLAYARAFAEPPSDCPGILIITPTAGLVAHDTLIHLPRLRGLRPRGDSCEKSNLPSRAPAQRERVDQSDKVGM